MGAGSAVLVQHAQLKTLEGSCCEDAVVQADSASAVYHSSVQNK